MIKVPSRVFEGLEKVRQSGVTNMLMEEQVQYYAFQNGDNATVIWIEDNPGLLTRGVFEGIESENGDTEEIQQKVSGMIDDGEMDYLYD